MKAKARIKEVKVSTKANSAIVELELETNPMYLDQFENKDIEVEMNDYEISRTISANAYYWQLLTKLARHRDINRSVPAMHNLMLQRYMPIREEVNGKYIEVYYDADFDVTELSTMHLQPTSGYAVDENGKVKTKYYVLKGSHNFAKWQFNDLIDGLVEECKQVGIQTATPEELERIKFWGH